MSLYDNQSSSDNDGEQASGGTSSSRRFTRLVRAGRRTGPSLAAMQGKTTLNHVPLGTDVIIGSVSMTTDLTRRMSQLGLRPGMQVGAVATWGGSQESSVFIV